MRVTEFFLKIFPTTEAFLTQIYTPNYQTLFSHLQLRRSYAISCGRPVNFYISLKRKPIARSMSATVSSISTKFGAMNDTE